MTAISDTRTSKGRYILRLAWVIVMTSCLSPIDFPTENTGGRMVISGQVSTIDDQNYIQLGRTASTERLPIPLSEAFIELFDDLGNVYNYTEDVFNPGIYRLIGFTGTPGRTYFIRVNTSDSETYESRPERMPESAGEFTTHYEFEREEVTDLEGIVTEQPFLQIFVNSIFPSESQPTYMKWQIEETFLLSPTDFPDPFGTVPPACFIVQNADPQRITLFSSDEVKAQSIENLLVGSRIIDWTFLERHYFTTYQTSLTKEGYEYWRKVNILANQVGSIFDTPPAEITGNIININDPSEKVLGYFQASNETFDRFYLLPSGLPFPLTVRTCLFDGRDFQDYQMRCLDCLSVRNSSHRRPKWF